MKLKIFLLLVFSSIGVWILFAKPEASITIHVVTDQGQSITNFPISLSTFDHWQPGESFGQDISIGYNQKTDAQGLVNFTIPSPRGDMAFGTPYNLQGYYPNIEHYQFKTNQEGKWQPWNPTIEMVVKPVLNPIPMYAQAVRLTIPARNIPVGFDLETGDWVSPYGKGYVSDFIFILKDKIPFVDASQPYDVTNILSFSNKGDGIQSVIVSQNQGTTFRMVCDAPQGGYDSILAQVLSLNGDKRLNGADGENQNYFFRVRTALDQQGKVKSALYGKTAGPIVCGPQGIVQFTYYLNPTPNDRNMEFDPSKNLFQNLTDEQQVKAP